MNNLEQEEMSKVLGSGELREMILQLNHQLTGSINALDQKLDRQINTLDQKVSRLFIWLVGYSAPSSSLS